MFIVENILDEHNDYYEFHKTLCEEYGELSLNPNASLDIMINQRFLVY